MAFWIVSAVTALVALSYPTSAAATPSAETPPVQMVRPVGWTVVERPAWLHMTPPEGDFTIDVIEITGATDARAAIAAAWHIADPAFSRALLQLSQDAAGDGWDERWSLTYVTTPDERLMVRANAMRSGTTWTVALLRGSVATVQKRSSAIIATMDTAAGWLRRRGFHRQAGAAV